MTRLGRWPSTFACLGLGLIGGFLANQKLIGQNGAPAPAAPRDPASYRDVVRKVMPAVVSIEGKAAQARTVGAKGPGEPAPPPPDADPGFGSGVLIDPSGVVVTNNHVVQNVQSVEVTLADGRKLVSADIRRDPKTDLAVVKLPAGTYPFLELADSDAIEVGDRVVAVGSPFGLTGSVTHGIVSAKGRYNLRFNQYEDFIQTDAAVNPGNSGGPLVNMDGKLIGITSAIKTRTGGFQGIALAISSNLTKWVSDQLLRDKVVRRGYLGVVVKPVPADRAEALKVPVGGGVLVDRTTAGGPADLGKVVTGDVLTTVAGRAVRDSRDLQRVASSLPIGKPVEVVVVRKGVPVTLAIAVAEQPEDFGFRPAEPVPPPPAGKPPVVGMTVTDISPLLVAQYKLPPGVRGVFVSAVARGGLAESSGVVRNAVVVQVNETPVATTAAFQDALARSDRGKGAVLSVLKPSGEVEYVLLRLQ